MVNKLLNKSKKKDTGKTIIIAEVGVNHDGSLDKAKKLIRVIPHFCGVTEQLILQL